MSAWLNQISRRILECCRFVRIETQSLLVSTATWLIRHTSYVKTLCSESPCLRIRTKSAQTALHDADVPGLRPGRQPGLTSAYITRHSVTNAYHVCYQVLILSEGVLFWPMLTGSQWATLGKFQTSETICDVLDISTDIFAARPSLKARAAGQKPPLPGIPCKGIAFK